MGERRLHPAWLYASAIVAALLVHLWAWEASYGVFSRSIDFNLGALEDFRGFYLTQGEDILDTGEPVPGFFYSPFFAILLAVFGGMDPVAACWTWLGFEIAVTAALIAGALWIVRPRPVWLGPAYVFAALLSFPLTHNLHWGQVSGLLALLVVVAVLLDTRGWRGSAAVALAVAASIKFYPALFLLVFVLRDDWRAVAIGMTAAALLLLGVPAAVLGVDQTLEFYRVTFAGLEQAESDPKLWAGAPNKQFLPAVLGRWTGQEGRAASLVFAAVGWLWAAANLVVARSTARSRTREGTALAFVAIALSLPLVVSPSWPHYLALLPCASLVVAGAGRRDPVTLVLVGMAALLASVPFFLVVGNPVTYGRAGWLLVADVLLLFGLYRARRRAAGPVGPARRPHVQ